MRYIDDNSGITFNNVKKIGSLIENCPSGNPNRYWYSDLNNSTVTGTDDTFNSINPNILGVINAIDIDWNEALVEDHVTVSTTGELISWIKTRPLVITLSFNPKILIATVNGVNIYIPDFQSLINDILARIAELEARVRALENGSNVLKIIITFNGNGGTIYGLSSWQRTISLGEEIGTLPVAERSGYNFNCWKTLNGEIIYNSTVLNEDTTLYAQWLEATPVVTQYTVTYHSNGGNSTPASQTVNAGETVTLAGAISRNADSSYTYEFSHWNTTSDNKGITYSAGQTIPVNNNINLYAQWNRTAISVEQCTVTFDANGGNLTPSPIIVDKNTKINLPAAITRDADESYTYSFKNWNTHRDESGSGYNAGQSYTVTTNVTLYAQWNKTEITPVTPTTEYYFSVGTTAPTASNYTTANNATTTIPTTKEFTNNSGSKSLIYILVPSNKTVTATDLAITSIVSPLIEDTSITIPNHKLYVTDGKIANGGGIKITIS